MMDGSKLGKDLKSAIDGIADKSDHALLWEAVGNVIVSHIQQNAVVLKGILVETAGSATSQKGATTQDGKIK